MDIKDFIAGTKRNAYEYKYFLPENINHSWEITQSKIQQKIEAVSLKLGELNSFSRFVPNIGMFIQSYVMKEAVTSSRIEGTKTNMEEAFSDEDDISQEHKDDWRETIQYREALNFALKELENIPLSNRLIKAVHKILLSQVRGEYKIPGEFRISQNWIGGTSLKDAVFIPPSHEYVSDLMSDIERFIHNDEIYIPHLIKIALIHYQFETIHPFLDGNGRTGRLLIPLYLVSVGILESPLLYISDFFEKHKSLYYDKLTFVREKNDLEGWILFFLEGVEQTAINAIQSLKEILELKAKIISDSLSQIGRKSQSAYLFLDALFIKPVVSLKNVQQSTKLSAKAANDLISDFVKLGILREVTGNKRNRLFVFDAYFKILSK